MRQSIGKTVVRMADGMVNTLVVIVLAVMLLFGLYSLWDTQQVYDGASSSKWSTYKPGPTAAEQLNYDQLRAINPDVIGWLQVYGTDIDYPICHTTDNARYVNYDAAGAYALSGCPFLDWRNSPDFTDFDNIVYGHHMDVPAMFGELDRFGAPEYFSTHRYGTLFHDGTLYGIDIFATFQTDAFDTSVYDPGIDDEAAKQVYLDNIAARAVQSRAVGESTDSELLVLSTCSPEETDGRYIVVARITDDVQPNPFADDRAAGGSALSLFDWLRLIPWWTWVALILLLLVLVVAIVRRMRQNETNEAPAVQEGVDTVVPATARIFGDERRKR